MQVFQANFTRPLTPAEHEILQASLTIAEQGHQQFTLTNKSAAQVLDRLHAALEQAPHGIRKPKARADLAAKIQAQTQTKLEQKPRPPCAKWECDIL